MKTTQEERDKWRAAVKRNTAETEHWVFSITDESQLRLLDDADDLARIREELTVWLEVDCAGGYADIAEERLRALLDGEVVEDLDRDEMKQQSELDRLRAERMKYTIGLPGKRFGEPDAVTALRAERRENDGEG